MVRGTVAGTSKVASGTRTGGLEGRPNLLLLVER